MTHRMSFLALAICTVTVGSARGAEPKTDSIKPEVLELNHTANNLTLRVRVTPGVPDPQSIATLVIEVGESLATPDPVLGKQRPISDATVRVSLNQPDGKSVQVREAQLMGDAGAYGASVSVGPSGVYGLYVDVKVPGKRELRFKTPFGVGLWPLPAKAVAPALPKILPKATTGNLNNGRAICDRICKRDVPFSRPPNHAPRFLLSAEAASFNDTELLAHMVGELSLTIGANEKADLLYYLHSLHLGVQDFFPEAGAFIAQPFTINTYGLERLATAANIKLQDFQTRGIVFVAYKSAAEDGGVQRIAFNDRVRRDSLKPEDKLGYVLFFDRANGAFNEEIGFALGREPTYPIVAVKARNSEGDVDPSLTGELQAFVGQGKFNDPKSFAGGNQRLRQKVVPLYLRAAELATMYYGEEREFTVFDKAFD